MRLSLHLPQRGQHERMHSELRTGPHLYMPETDASRIAQILAHDQRFCCGRRDADRVDFVGAEMTKREQLHQWLMNVGDWVYARQVPYSMFNSIASASSALRDLCASGRADFRIVGIKQYRGKPGATPVKGPKPPKGMK